MGMAWRRQISEPKCKVFFFIPFSNSSDVWSSLKSVYVWRFCVSRNELIRIADKFIEYSVKHKITKDYSACPVCL